MVRSGRPLGVGNLPVDRKRRGARHQATRTTRTQWRRRPRSRHPSESCAHPGHIFLSDDLSLLDRGHVDASRILATDQVTDTYLLALARLNGVPWPASVAG